MSLKSSIKRYRELEGSPWTSASLITYAGVLLMGEGVRRGPTTKAGFAFVAGALLCDKLDGMEAKRTGQTSPRGAANDATADKLKKIMLLYAGYRDGFIPSASIASIVAINVTNVALTDRFENANPDKEYKANWYGQNGEWWQASGVLAYAAADLITNEAPTFADHTEDVGLAATAMTAVGVGSSIIAAFDYWRRGNAEPAE